MRFVFIRKTSFRYEENNKNNNVWINIKVGYKSFYLMSVFFIRYFFGVTVANLFTLCTVEIIVAEPVPFSVGSGSDSLAFENPSTSAPALGLTFFVVLCLKSFIKDCNKSTFEMLATTSRKKNHQRNTGGYDLF